jgi:RimJ/RimL family protein N-acetyltransferase
MLKGNRVSLRAVERDDLPRIRDIERDQVELMLEASGSWRPQHLGQYEKDWESWTNDKSIYWFVIEADGKIIGTADLHNMDRRDGTAEMGIGIFVPEYLGKGYGRDAIRLLIDFAFRIQNLRRLWLETYSVNVRAQRSYAACGFVEEGRLRQHAHVNGQYVDMVVMGLLRSEWEAARATSAITAIVPDPLDAIVGMIEDAPADLSMTVRETLADHYQAKADLERPA